MIMFGTSSLNLLMKWTMLDPASFLKIKQVNKMVDTEQDKNIMCCVFCIK